MGLFGIGDKITAANWQAWTIAVAKNPSEFSEFRINPEKNTDVSVFNAKLAELSDDLIKQYDTNGDKKISYEEYEEFELKQLNKNVNNIDEEMLKRAKEDLKTAYSHLNVDNEGDSKDGLDRRELMNMFHTMDAFNDDFINDGFVSNKEYIETVLALSDRTSMGEKMFGLLKANYNIFKNYK